jgi:hypothetical protein
MTIKVHIRFELSTGSREGVGQWYLSDVTKWVETVTDVVTFSITATRVFFAYNFAVIPSRFRSITSNKIDARRLRIVQRHAGSASKTGRIRPCGLPVLPAGLIENSDAFA